MSRRYGSPSALVMCVRWVRRILPVKPYLTILSAVKKTLDTFYERDLWSAESTFRLGFGGGFFARWFFSHRLGFGGGRFPRFPSSGFELFF